MVNDSKAIEEIKSLTDSELLLQCKLHIYELIDAQAIDYYLLHNEIEERQLTKQIDRLIEENLPKFKKPEGKESANAAF